MKAIISGGGTGGHTFPAIAIANSIKARDPQAEILFIGAEGRMEMEKVPAAGYPIEGLPIAGLQRQLTLSNICKNLLLPFKVLRSMRRARQIIRSFNPDVVIGVGGYASQPTLQAASQLGYPIVLQEQNSYAGLTNKSLSSKADVICVAYEGMERFFPSDKLVQTGNPVRKDIEQMNVSHEDGCAFFQVDANRPVLLSVGGSLGARSINLMIMNNLDFFKKNNLQIIWQTGRQMYDQACKAVEDARVQDWVKVHQFIGNMDKAYAAADAVISRAGAIAISELCLVGKPVVLIPSPNVAEDHQTKKAMALSEKGAAILVRDSECGTEGLPTALALISDKERCDAMSQSIRKLASPHAADRIVDEIYRLLDSKRHNTNHSNSSGK